MEYPGENGASSASTSEPPRSLWFSSGDAAAAAAVRSVSWASHDPSISESERQPLVDAYRSTTFGSTYHSVDARVADCKTVVLGLTLSGRWPTPFARPWLLTRAVLMILLMGLPWLVYPPSVLREVWFAPFMTTVAVLLPASGVPIAGGIVFFPVLSLAGFHPDSAVAFAAATQAVGVGVFTPLTWYVQEPNVFLRVAFPPAVLGSSISCALAVYVWPSQSEWVTVAVFTAFAAFCAVFVFHGLFCGELSSSRKEVPRTRASFTWCFLAGVVGGFLVGYIGIGVEKTLFIVLSGVYQADPKRSGITSVTVVGLVSFFNAAYHFFVTRDVPIPAWLFGLQGLLVGSFLGPASHRILGRRFVLFLFGTLLLVDVGNNCACLFDPTTCENIVTENV